MSEQPDRPKLYIDSDWKREAQAEKERLSRDKEKEKEKAPGPPKLQVDADWKAEAVAEKDRLARQVEEKSKGRPRGGELPEASFTSLVNMLASQAVMGLGALADRQSGGIVLDLEGARFAIDLLSVIEEKTRNNLSAQEADDLKQVLAELRARYVYCHELVARQAKQPPAPAKK
jgi:hypothetical protein